MRFRPTGDAIDEGCEASDESGRCGAVPVWMSGWTGRRCDAHRPTYDRDRALALVDRGDVATAFAHLRAHLAFRAGGAR